MATMQPKLDDITISAEAVDFLSQVAEGFDELILRWAEMSAARRSGKAREVTTADVKQALNFLCETLRTSLEAGHFPPDRREAISDIIQNLQKLGTAC